MISLIYGGSSSGKSEYAESLAVSLSREGSRYYIATMDSHGEEAKRRIRKHLAQREGKGFITIECPCNICEAAKDIADIGNAVLLIESVPTLLANEMFGNGRYAGILQKNAEKDPDIAGQTAEELLRLCRSAGHAVLVSDNIFEDGMEYDDLSRQYAGYLGKINIILAKEADEAVQVSAGLPFPLKKSIIKTCSGDSDCGYDSMTTVKELQDMKNTNAGMILVTGGFAQGKLSWVKEQAACRGDVSLIIDETSFEDISPDFCQDILIVDHFHLIIRRLGSADHAIKWLEKIRSVCKEKKVLLIIIADEVGCGVVPADFESIRYRENAGDAVRYAAGAAERVYRITCGIPTVLKPQEDLKTR